MPRPFRAQCRVDSACPPPVEDKDTSLPRTVGKMSGPGRSISQARCGALCTGTGPRSATAFPSCSCPWISPGWKRARLSWTLGASPFCETHQRRPRKEDLLGPQTYEREAPVAVLMRATCSAQVAEQQSRTAARYRQALRRGNDGRQAGDADSRPLERHLHGAKSTASRRSALPRKPRAT